MRKPILIALGCLALVAMLFGDGIAAAWRLGWLKGVGAQDSKVASGSERKSSTSIHRGKVLFVSTGKMVVTLPASSNSSTGQGYLQVDVSFATYDKNAAVTFDAYKPMVKASIISAVMGNGNELSTGSAAAKKMLTKKALAIADNVVSYADPKLSPVPFSGAYITDFILQ